MSAILVTCVGDSAEFLGVPARNDAYATNSSFESWVKVGARYMALGMGIFRTELQLLVYDDESMKPNWLPIGLFDIDAHALPADWEFRVLDPKGASGGPLSGGWVALWGYPDLVRNPGHSDGLLLRNADALEVFTKELLLAREILASQQTDEIDNPGEIC
jgi:hypothetical protein